jgi:D-tyrosyl-tRNA(Tyr) deacylase
VRVGTDTLSSIESGYLILLGIFADDTEEDGSNLAKKIAEIRVMQDGQGKMNRSLEETRGGALVVSQFTLCADTRKGRRPSFIGAMEPSAAKVLYSRFVDVLRERIDPVRTGQFGAHMEVELVNDGPVTLILDSRR